MNSFLFDPTTGNRVREIRASYRWMLRHMREITKVEISERPNGGAIVTVYTLTVALREERGSVKLAMRRFTRWGFKPDFYAYHPLTGV